MAFTKIALSLGILQVRSFVPPKVPARNQTWPVCLSAQFLPVGSAAGLSDFGIECSLDSLSLPSDYNSEDMLT
jgi:hypothetical protein